MLGGTKIRLGRGDAAGGGVVLVPRAELCWMKGHMGRGGRATSEGWGMPHGISPPPPPGSASQGYPPCKQTEAGLAGDLSFRLIH